MIGLWHHISQGQSGHDKTQDNKETNLGTILRDSQLFLEKCHYFWVPIYCANVVHLADLTTCIGILYHH